ncbi:MAG TPA: HIT family protein [Candidatus Nanoarchaeia archaeon]|nr:HIT family protein [Candidatus Nanoarchaeia archaeon]
MASTNSCIFCRISNGEIPCHKVYEDAENLAFLDVQPHAQGHTVIIPKTHARSVFELNDQKYLSLMSAVKKAMKKIQDRLDPDGFNVGWNHNTAGGQVVPHLHVHIMPRYNGDNGGSIHSIIKNPGKKSVEEVAKLFK